MFTTRPLVLGIILGVFLMFSMIFLASAFIGPSQSPPSGYGAIVSNSQNSIALGTSTVAAATKVLIVGSSTASSDYGLRITQPSGSNILTVRNDGRVGVGTASPNYKLDVSGDIKTGNGSLLIVGSNSSDPAGVTGAIYFNTTSNVFRCYATSTWVNCDTGGSAVYQ